MTRENKTSKDIPKIIAKSLAIRSPLSPVYNGKSVGVESFCVEDIENNDCFYLNDNFSEVIVKVPKGSSYLVTRGGDTSISIPIKFTVAKGFDLEFRTSPHLADLGMFIIGSNYFDEKLRLTIIATSSADAARCLSEGDELAVACIRQKIIFSGNYYDRKK